MTSVCIVLKITTKQSVVFGHPVLQWMQPLYPQYSYFDLDNFSEPMLFDYAIQLVQQAEEVVLFLDIEDTTAANKAISWLERILKTKAPLRILLWGEQPFMSLLLQKSGMLFRNVQRNEHWQDALEELIHYK